MWDTLPHRVCILHCWRLHDTHGSQIRRRSQPEIPRTVRSAATAGKARG
nr:MAG TPA: hypothetical protein [Caudoviricetes sp.]